MFKELNTSKFSHVGSVNDFALMAEKEKQIETFLESSEVNDAFSWRNLLKFGIPNSLRYQFYKKLAQLSFKDQFNKEGHIKRVHDSVRFIDSA